MKSENKNIEKHHRMWMNAKERDLKKLKDEDKITNFKRDKSTVKDIGFYFWIGIIKLWFGINHTYPDTAIVAIGISGKASKSTGNKNKARWEWINKINKDKLSDEKDLYGFIKTSFIK